jgi:hypothetical protein
VMNRFLKIVVVLSIITAFLSSISCDKISDEIDRYDVSIDDVKEVAFLEIEVNFYYNDIFTNVLQAASFANKQINSLGLGKNSEIVYPNISFNWVSMENPFAEYYLFVDYGENNFKDSYGITRRGGLTLHCKGKWGEQGSTISVLVGTKDLNTGAILRENFYINDTKIEGDIKFVSLGNNAYERIVKNALITFADNNTPAERNSSLTIKQIVGNETIDISDDSFEFYGVIEGVTPNGIDYGIEIPTENPIVKGLDCLYPTEGITFLNIKAVEFAVDYAFDNNECDRRAVINFYGVNTEIEF